MDISNSIIVNDNFNEFFEENTINNLDIDINRKNVNFSILKIKANNFDSDNFFTYLKEISITYALPKERVKNLKDQGKIMQLCDETRRKFIDSAKKNNGEGGELILYSFLENHLKAPKLLSKMKLKTNSSMPVYGADGIHILNKDDFHFEIIYCESKMYNDFNIGINQAFASVEKLLNNTDYINFENTIVSTNLAGEFNDETVENLCNIVLPSRENYKTNPAISIFIGFEFNTTEYDKSLDYKDYTNEVVKDIESKIKNKKKRFEDYFKKHSQYSFYVYLLPFENIDEARKKIIEGIEGGTFE